MNNAPCRWGLLWRSLDSEHVMWHDLKPLLFQTRSEARAWSSERYGYIRTRQDLRRAPHGWRVPQPVLIDVVLRPVRVTT